MMSVIKWSFILFAGLMLLQACTTTGSAPLQGDTSAPQADNYDSSGTAAEAGGGVRHSGIVIFPHLPVPYALEKKASETVVFTTPDFHGGIFTLKGSISKESAAEFFQRRLPEEGWRLAGLLDSETCYMAFRNSTGGSCLIQIASANMGLKIEVRIFVSEGPGEDNVIR